jgi:hypothetical protein
MSPLHLKEKKKGHTLGEQVVQNYWLHVWYERYFYSLGT